MQQWLLRPAPEMEQIRQSECPQIRRKRITFAMVVFGAQYEASGEWEVILGSFIATNSILLINLKRALKHLNKETRTMKNIQKCRRNIRN